MLRDTAVVLIETPYHTVAKSGRRAMNIFGKKMLKIN